MEIASKRMILRIELWHAIVLSGLLVTLGHTKLIEPMAVLMGGVFMGLNFFLLSFGVAWVLTPLANRRKVKAGVALLIFKIVMFLALLTTMFFQFEIDAISFSLGVSSLLLAIVGEALRTSLKLRL
jgi:hypothetical protein